MFELCNKTILITGASSGIGRESAVKIAQQGATLILLGRNETELIKTESLLVGSDHKYYVIDLTNDDEIKDLVKNIDNIDGMVLAAGVNQICFVRTFSRKMYEKLFNTNFLSPVLLIKEFVKKKKINDMGSIVLISSIGSIKGTIGTGFYAATKGAINSVMLPIASELAPNKVRINAILPGFVMTKMNEMFSEEQIENEIKKYPLGEGTTTDIANGCVFLLSNEAKWITGTKLVIDGGASIK